MLVIVAFPFAQRLDLLDSLSHQGEEFVLTLMNLLEREIAQACNQAIKLNMSSHNVVEATLLLYSFCKGTFLNSYVSSATMGLVNLSAETLNSRLRTIGLNFNEVDYDLWRLEELSTFESSFWHRTPVYLTEYDDSSTRDCLSYPMRP